MRIKTGGLLAILIAVAVAFIAIVEPARASSSAESESPRRERTGPPKFGFADEIDQHVLAMPAAADLGATIARFGIPWYYSDWSRLDVAYGYFYSYGIRPIFTLYVTPPPPFVPPSTIPTEPLPAPPEPGPQPPPSGLPPVPPVPDVENFQTSEYVAQAVYIAQRYPFAKIQILNEPNLPVFRAFPVEKTVEVITETARAVHAIAPDMKLIGPASSPDQGRGYTYTRDVYRSLPADLDYVEAAINIYPGPGKRRAFRQVKKTWRTAKASGRRIWVTEITPGIYSPRKRRCNQVKEAFSYLKRRGAKGILFFRLREPAVFNVQGRLWAINADGTKTDLYRCLKKTSEGLIERGRSAQPRLKLSVVDRSRIDAGTRIRARFQTTARPDYGSLGDGPKRPAAGAVVRFAGERASTNRRGRAAITATVSKALRLRARASLPGYRGDAVTVATRRVMRKALRDRTGGRWRKPGTEL